MSAEEPPRWLPDGWIMKVKKGKDGKEDRYYTSPVSGYTFHSKADVLRYLNVEKVAGQAPKSLVCFEDGNQHIVEQAKDSPLWLPAGWILEIRARKSGSRYKCYFDPSTGNRFYSKAEVFRHLKAGKSCSPTPKRKRSTNKDYKDNVLAQIESSPDGLPSGWIKETKFRRNASGLRKDPYYTDPVSGLVFRSRKDVYRYIETGEISKHAARPKKKIIKEMYPAENESPPPIAASKLKWHGNTVRRRLFSGQIPNSRGKMAEENGESSAKEPCLLLPYHHASPQCVEDVYPSCLTLPDVAKQVETVQVSNVLSKEPLELVEGKLLVQEQSKKPKSKKGKKLVLEQNLLKPANEKSLKPEEEPPELVNEGLSEPASGKLDKGPKRPANGKLDKGPKRPANGSSGFVPTKAKAVKVTSLPQRASKRLAGLEADPTAAIEISDFSFRSAKRYALSKANSSKLALNGRADHLETVSMHAQESSGKPKGEEFVEEQVEEKPGAGNTADETAESASPVTLPFGDSWPDPCIEFAFKTLTGDIPVFEDTSIVQDYFHQQLTSAQTLSCPGSSSVAYGSSYEYKQLDILAQLESTRKQNLPPFSLENDLESKGKANNEPK